MNKKGDVATGILLIVTIALILASLGGMLSFNSKLDSESKLLSEMMYEIEFRENYVRGQASLVFNKVIKNCIGCENEVLKLEIIKFAGQREQLNRYEGAGNLYAKFRNGEFELVEEEGERAMKIMGLFVEAQRGENRIRRNFELELKTNKDL